MFNAVLNPSKWRFIKRILVSWSKMVENWQTPKTQLARMLSQQKSCKTNATRTSLSFSHGTNRCCGRRVVSATSNIGVETSWQPWNLKIYQFRPVGTRSSCGRAYLHSNMVPQLLWGLIVNTPTIQKLLKSDEYLPWPSPVISLKVKPRTALWNWWWKMVFAVRFFDQFSSAKLILASWWFQLLWKILVKMGIFPK